MANASSSGGGAVIPPAGSLNTGWCDELYDRGGAMFHVELNDDGVELCNYLFHITPVMVFSRWTSYTGTAVWRVNQHSTYSLPGEPSDSRWGDLFADGVFTDHFNQTTQQLDGPVRRMWALLKEQFPAEYEKRTGQSHARSEYDRETMFVHAAMVVGGAAKKDANGEWTIEHPDDKPRKKFLGIF